MIFLDLLGKIATSNRLSKQVTSLGPVGRWRADGVVTASGKVTTIQNWISGGGDLSQATSAQQCSAPTSDSALNNRLSMSLAGSQWYDNALAASSWAYPSAGTGFEVFHVFVATTVGSARVMLSTRDASGTSTDIGFAIYRNGANNFGFQIQQGTLTTLVSNSGTVAIGTGYYVNASYKEGDPTEWFLRRGQATLTSGASSRNPVSTTPSGSLRLGANIGNGGPDLSRWAETIIFNRVLSTAERTIVQAYLAREYNLT